MVANSLTNRPWLLGRTTPIDVNSASPTLLRQIPGVGARTVQRLLLIRRQRRIVLQDLQRLHVPMQAAKPLVITADYRPRVDSSAAGNPFRNETSAVSHVRAPRERQLGLFGSTN